MTKRIFLVIAIFLIIGILVYYKIFLKPLLYFKYSGKIKKQGNMYITSPAFGKSEIIPTKYTCDGENVNPPLIIAGVPQNSKSLVLIVEDPDAPMGTWSHWIVYNINPNVNEIKENEIPDDGIEIVNSFGTKSYGGPCPPPGPAHRYFFKIYALDTKFLEQIQTKEELIKKMEGHIIIKSSLMGVYSR